ncbi:CDP-alcohol phosphatidyltransferase family protein [Candidatus Parcubacteria bacterium]|jgi:phosphatidylglycerophosphate synthase|nr:CDP-alcohol phosphatidyltransferase family protein [Candidatus Parcubacteria bacterium]MBT7228590.1 CDP-alcohol phosphatidyltransferase family protein [Candidatus Parcubacteria bacterium]
MSELDKIDKYLDDYSETEQTYYQRTKAWRDKLFYPLALLFKKIGASADIVSYLGVLVLAGFLLYATSNPRLAVLFLLLNLLMDGIDGAIARVNNSESAQGALVDTLCDLLSIFIVIFTLGFVGLLNPNIGIVYIFFFSLMIFFIISRQLLDIPVRFVVRSKAFVYVLYIWWAFTGQNYFDWAVFIFTVLIFLVCVASFIKIKNRLKGKKIKLKDF